MNITSRAFVGFAAVIGASLVVAAIVAGFYFYRVKSLADVVSVTGSSQRVITSDVVKWRGTFSRNVPSNSLERGNQQMKGDLDKIVKYLEQGGVENKAITIQPVIMNPVYRQDASKGYYYGGGGEVESYTLNQTILVESTEVEKITKLAQDAGILINQGVPFSSQPLEYYYSKLADLKVEMLAEATKNSQDRARKIVESTGAKLGSLKAASMGVMQITPVNSTEVSDYGYYDTSSIEKQITAVVRSSFAVE